MKKPRRLIFIAIAFIAAHVIVPIAAAHPLGNFTINHYAGLHVTREAVTIDYVLDMAEIPAFQEIATFDANGNGQPEADETAGYHSSQCDAIRSGLDLRVNGQPAAITLNSSAIEFPAGAGGLLTLRLTCAFRASIASTGESHRLEFQDNSYAERLGWREIVVTGEGISLEGNFASRSVSNRLTTYPDDLLSSPLNQRYVALSFTLAAVPDESTSSVQSPTSNLQLPTSNRDDVFTRLITLPDLNPATLVFALLVSFAWGAMHAMSPGHGKGMVAAYLVGTRGTPKHAVVLGLTVTATHTLGVFVLGLVVLFASNYILPEQLYPWLSLASGVLVIGIGVSLVVVRIRAIRSGRGLMAHTHADHMHDHHDHDHDHTHEHVDHAHDRGHAHEQDHRHGSGRHTHTPVDGNGRVTMRSLVAMGISGGLIPCPTALVVLLSAVALGRVVFGMTLIVVFSAGLAAVLVGIGLLLVSGRRLLDRLPVNNRALHLIPLAGACLVIITGAVMTIQAVSSVGALSV